MRRDAAARRWTLAPALVLFTAVALVPIGELIAMSMSRIDWFQGKAKWRFVGLDQYAQVFGDALFRAGVVNTMVFAVVAVVTQMILGFVLALMTTRIRRARVLYRTVFMLRDIEGLSTSETGQGLGLGDEAVKTRLHRARVMIRRAVTERIGEVAHGSCFAASDAVAGSACRRPAS